MVWQIQHHMSAAPSFPLLLFSHLHSSIPGSFSLLRDSTDDLLCECWTISRFWGCGHVEDIPNFPGETKTLSESYLCVNPYI